MTVRYAHCLLILSFLAGCSGFQEAEEKKVRERNLTAAPIQRQSNETFFALPPVEEKKIPHYPWKARRIGSHLRITKEFFRCKGKLLNPPLQLQRNNQVFYHLDCGGIEKHSLPLRDGKEFIYPILIDLLNYVQKKTQKKVVITCGHRCPTHNLYADPSKRAQTSKHLVGAEVDFYVEGMEHSPEDVIQILKSYYETPFNRSQMPHVDTPIWINREITITLYQPPEGRDLDNQHSYPYLSIQVNFDQERKRPVQYNWHQAHNCFIKH